MKKLTQVSNVLQLPEYIRRLKEKIVELSYQVGETLQRQKSSFIDQHTVKSLSLVNTFLENKKKFASNSHAIESDINDSLYSYINTQLVVNFSIFLKSDHVSDKVLFRKFSNFNLEDFLDNWYKWYIEHRDIEIEMKLSERLAEGLTDLVRSDLEAFFSTALYGLFREILIPKIKELNLNEGLFDEKSLEDFRIIFGQKIDKHIIPLLVKKFQANIEDVISGDCEKITAASSGFKILEMRTETLEGKAEKLEQDKTTIEVNLGKIFTFKTETRHRMIGLYAFIASIILVLIYAFFLIFPSFNKLKERVKSIPDYTSEISNINVKLQGLEDKLDQILENQMVIKTIGGKPWQTYIGEKKAADGSTIVRLEINILSDIYRWKCNDFQHIVWGSEYYDPLEIFQDYKRNDNLKNAKGLICIGLASSEGEEGGEEERAQQRTDTLRNSAISANIEKICPIYGLNLGQYVDTKDRGECSDSTLWQRRVILLKIVKQQPGLSDPELTKSVIEILENKSDNRYITFPINIRNYSLYRKGKLTLDYGTSRSTGNRIHE